MVTSISIILSILIIISLYLLICISTYLTYLNPIYFLKIRFLEDHANMFSKTYSLGISVKVVNNYSKWSSNYFRKASVYPWSRYSHFIRFMSTGFFLNLKASLQTGFWHSRTCLCAVLANLACAWPTGGPSGTPLPRCWEGASHSESHRTNTVIMNWSQYILMWVLCFFHTKSSNQ